MHESTSATAVLVNAVVSKSLPWSEQICQLNEAALHFAADTESNLEAEAHLRALVAQLPHISADMRFVHTSLK